MNDRTVHVASRVVSAFILGLSVLCMSLPCAASGQTEHPIQPGTTTTEEVPRVKTDGGTRSSGLDNTPSGGKVPGGTVTGGTVPGGTVPGGPAPGGVLPGGTVPGGPVQGGPLPGGTVPGGTVPSKKLPGEDG